MQKKDQYSSLIYNPTINRAARPQTPGPGGNRPIPTQFNQSYSKNSGGYSPYKYNVLHNFNQNPNISKSRVSVQSTNSQLSFLNADQGQVFPEDLLFLLRNQQKNINNFKQKIEKQKSRVQNDFAVLKTQIDHILQDLKLSVQAKLDLVYKIFISKYAQVKGQVQQIRRVRKQILMANQVSISQKNNYKDTSNQDIMNQIVKDAEHFRNFRIYGYLSEMQKQKLNPILDLCNELILIGSIDSPFYRSKQMTLKHKDIKSSFTTSLGQVYQRLNEYVITPQAIVQKDKQQQQNNGNILKNLQIENQIQPNLNPFLYNQNNGQGFAKNNVQRQAFDVMYPENKPKNVQWDNKTSDINKKVPILGVSKSEKSILTKWAQNINLKKLQRVVTDHNDSILCIFFIQNRFIATGSKDKTINIYTIDGKKVTTLRGHQASICSLSCITNRNNQTFLASGSDHGCCCLILWDTKTWNISSRIQSHVAAVTSIVDLQDGQHLVTGSYDKKINLFNHARGQVISSYSNKSAVTSIVLTSDRQKLVSSSLDNSLLIWTICLRQNGLSLEMERAISMNSMICVLQACVLRPEVVIGATRDGKIKMFNINSQTEVQKIFTVNENSIIQLLLIERQMKVDSPMVLSCSSKDKSLCVTKMDSGQSQLLKTNGAFNIEFGCGIGPKIVMSANNIMAILSQSANARQFSLYQMELK